MPTINEAIVEDATLTWFGELGYAIAHGQHKPPTTARYRVNKSCTLATLRDALLPKLLSVKWCVDVGTEKTEAVA